MTITVKFDKNEEGKVITKTYKCEDITSKEVKRRKDTKEFELFLRAKCVSVKVKEK